MNQSKAIKLAIQCIDREIQRIAVQANLHDIHGMEWTSAKGASKRRAELQEAKEALLLLVEES